MMQIDAQDRALREAAAHLTKAIQALHAVEAYGLASDAFVLANRVLQARQALQVPSAATV